MRTTTLMRPADVANEYGIPTRLLATMRCERRGPRYVKTDPSGPGAVYYRRADVEKWLERCTVETGAGAA